MARNRVAWIFRPGRAACKTEARDTKNGVEQAEQDDEFPDSSPKLKDLLLELNVLHVENIQGDSWPGRFAKPACGGGARDAKAGSDARVTCLLNKVSKAVVVGLLMSALDCHGAILTNRISVINPAEL